MRLKVIFYVIMTAITITATYGQKSGKLIKIKGSVVDGTEASIANAIIMIDGEKTGYLTDKNGSYKIKVKQESKKIGIFTYTNGIVEEALDGRSTINFKFEGSVPDQISDKINPDEESIDVGYGHVKRKQITGSVGKIDGTNPKYDSYNDIYEMIRGEVPGVQVNGKSIMIRGATTIYSSTEPLFVVDGVPVMTIDNIIPQMVKSIEVLKGSSAAIYGSRGSNGVIIINLKTGKDR
jgi:TonB-dependent starch-binding outer membrane protein SusC